MQVGEVRMGVQASVYRAIADGRHLTIISTSRVVEEFEQSWPIVHPCQNNFMQNLSHLKNLKE